MGQNLTGKTIASTYEDLVQISGSILTDGTGSDITSLTVTASYANEALNASTANTANIATTATSASYASFATTALTSSYALTASFAENAVVDSGSFMITGSVTSNTLTFEKGDGSTFSLTVDTGSAVTTDTGSLLVTASISDATITFTKGDATTFPITVNNVSNASSASVAVSASLASLANQVKVSTASNSFVYQVPFVANDGNETVWVDSESTKLTYVPATNTLAGIDVLNATKIVATSITGSLNGNADTATSASYATTALSASYAPPAATPNLQSVTTAGNTTSGSITINDNTQSSLSLLANTATFTSIDDVNIMSLAFYDAAYIQEGLITFNPSNGDLNISSTFGTATLQGNATTATSASHAITANTASFLPSDTNLNITSITASGAEFANLIATSASIGFLQTVTGSATIIGDAYIILNTSNATRYAGIKVEDSGSATPVNYTASLNFDSLTNDWFYEYTSSGDPDNFGVVLFGPEYNTIGVPTYPTNNRLVKGNGGHHLNDSTISDDGTLVTIDANVSASGYVSASQFVGNLTGNATTATSASHAVNADNAISASFAVSASYAPSTTPDLQSVTTVGNTTSGSIIINDNVQSTLSLLANTATFNSIDDVNIMSLAFYDAAYIQEGLITFNPSNGDLNISSTFGTVTLNGNATTATSASYALTASYVEGGINPFPFTGSAQITGSLSVTGSYNRLSGSFSGSLIDNITDVYSSTAKVEHITTLTQAEYNAISASADPNTLYYITDAPSFVTSASYAVSASYALSSSYSLTATTASFYSLASVNQDVVITGSVRGNVQSLFIGSDTASIDLSSGNFFDLSIVSGSDTYVEFSNIAPGQTINLKVNQPNPGNGTVSFPSYVKQVSGSAYVPTTGSGATDIVTFIAFDSTNLYLSNVKNLV